MVQRASLWHHQQFPEGTCGKPVLTLEIPPWEDRPTSSAPTWRLAVIRLAAFPHATCGHGKALSLSSVEKHAIFAKLGLSSEPLVPHRVAAVLTLLRDAGLRPPG
ncbi:MAG TPA: hypothetical protein VF163_19775 [Micromonosporaceae bacterium]